MEHEIEAVIWHSDGERIEVIYTSGTMGRLMATRDIAHAFAREIDLPFEARTDESVRWRGSSHGPSSPENLG